MADMNQQGVIAAEIFFHHFPGEIEPDGAWPGHLLQDEAFATEEAGAEPLLEGKLQGHGFFGAKESFLAADQALAGTQRTGDDGTGKARREGDMAAALGGEIGDEEAAATHAALQA